MSPDGMGWDPTGLVNKLRKMNNSKTKAPKQTQVRATHIGSAHFTYENAAERNRIFLLENHDTRPFMRPAKGWEIVGYGKAPWPGSTEGFAAMFERIDPPEEKTRFHFPDRHATLPIGTRIWQHVNRDWIDSLGLTPPSPRPSKQRGKNKT